MDEPLLERLNSGATWDELRLPASSRATLDTLAKQMRGTLAIFSGPPSVGKARAAEALAARLGVPGYRVDLSRVVSAYIGETEKNLARVFDGAESGGAVLLFDEADALFGRRTVVRDAHDRYANQEIDFFLSRLEAFGGVVILASHRPDDLAPAVRKRRGATVPIPRLRA